MPRVGARIDHIGYVVPDLDDAMGRFGDLFGLTWGEPARGFEREFLDGRGRLVRWRLDVVSSRASSTPGGIAIELLRGDPGTTWHTPGPVELHHVAYRVEEVPGACADLTADGWLIDLRHADALTRPATFAYLTHPETAQRIELLAPTR